MPTPENFFFFGGNGSIPSLDGMTDSETGWEAINESGGEGAGTTGVSTGVDDTALVASRISVMNLKK